MSTVAWRFGWLLLALFPSGQYLLYILGATALLSVLCFALDRWVTYRAQGFVPADHPPYLWFAKIFCYLAVGLLVTQGFWLVLAVS